MHIVSTFLVNNVITRCSNDKYLFIIIEVHLNICESSGDFEVCLQFTRTFHRSYTIYIYNYINYTINTIHKRKVHIGMAMVIQICGFIIFI